jgi:predicted transcriptional regulator
MAIDLYSYHMNPVKSGRFWSGMKEKYGYTNERIDELTGIPEGTVKRILKGQTKLSFEAASKLCILFKIPIESYNAIMYEGVDTDFADEILTYDPTKSKTTPLTADDVTPIEDTLPEAVVEATLAVTDVAPPPITDNFHGAVEQEYIKRIEELKAEVDRQDYIIRQLLEILNKR